MYSDYCHHSFLCTKILCVLLIINVNQYGAMLSTQTEKWPMDLSLEADSQISLYPYSNIQNIQSFPFKRDLTAF